MSERATAKISKKNLVNNITFVKKRVPPNCKILAVVKANAYAHGAIECTKIFLEHGADMLAVATLPEAQELRAAGINSDILIFSELLPSEVLQSIDLNLISTVYSYNAAYKLAKTVPMGKKHRVHIKIDTGMSRVGIYCHKSSDIDNVTKEAIDIYNLQNLSVEGIYTHFSCADFNDKSFTKKQFEIFDLLTKTIIQSGVDIGIRHCSSSAGILYHPEYCLDMVRAGIMLYGFSPKPMDSFSSLLKPAMEVSARIITISDIKCDDIISYGGSYKATKTIKAATVAFGYADGYSRLLSNNDYLLINGKKATVLGKVCMDMVIVDISGIECKVGDRAVIFGYSDKTADEIAEKLNTISYEVLCNMGGRVKRIYE